MLLSDKGIQLIQAFESCRLSAYQDSKKVWTIGYGNTYYRDGAKVKKGDRITQARANALFAEIIARFVVDVNKLLDPVEVKQHQFDALVSFAYNVGSDIDADNIAEGLGDSTLLKLVRDNPDNIPEIRAEFLKWNKVNKEVVFGLTRRRRSEAYLYATGIVNLFN